MYTGRTKWHVKLLILLPVYTDVYNCVNLTYQHYSNQLQFENAFNFLTCTVKGAQGQFSTFYPLTQSVELLYGAAVTLLTLGLCILLQGCHRERLLQSQHDLIHLQQQNTVFFRLFFNPSIIQPFNNLSVHL